MKHWIALIPAYEPDEKLPELVKECKAAGLDPVVIDDGSGERFWPLMEACRPDAVVLTHRENRGKGAALKTGFGYILDTYGRDSVVVTMDCDGQHKVSDAVRLCRYVELHPGELALGSLRALCCPCGPSGV